MIPIVFCASFVPWLKLYAPAERSCRRLKWRSACSRWKERVVRSTRTMKRKPTISPMIGEITMNSATTRTVESFTAARPAAEIPAPVRPPIRAWDEEVGRPIYQVIMFQLIAPIRAASTM